MAAHWRSVLIATERLVMAQLLIAVLDVERLLAHSASHLQLAQPSRIGDQCRCFGAIGFEIEEACTDAFSENGLETFQQRFV
jgi:hypothetical protein